MKKARLNLDNTSPTANQLASSKDAFLRLRTLPQDQNSASPVQKIYNDLVEKVTFASRNYKYDYNFAPGIQFFKFLTNYPEIKKVFKKFEV